MKKQHEDVKIITIIFFKINLSQIIFFFKIKNIDRIRKAYKTQLTNAIVKITKIADVCFNLNNFILIISCKFKFKLRLNIHRVYQKIQI